ncbi:MAG: hypothetical protein ACRC6M_08595 [Microcystaceae cyanobacterium]
MTEPLCIYGYHGTNITRASAILHEGFNISSNEYDWLGTGVYFFQDAPLRAWQWANALYPDNPVVIRALIQLENCLDLFDVGWFPLLRNLYSSFIKKYENSNQPLPKQNPERSKAHRLDCSFFNYIVDILAQEEENIEVIRGIFSEGDRIYANSAIFDLAHVQLAVRNTAIIREIQILNMKEII